MVSKIGLFIPTYNAGKNFENILEKISEQSNEIDVMYMIDSGSKDNTVLIGRKFGFSVKEISPINFGHGKTRTEAAKDLNELDYLIFMTQDVYLQDNAIKNLIDFIKKDDKIAVAYGKQEVDLNKGSIFEWFSREYNYPSIDMKKTIKDKKLLGIKTVFSSNAFAIYDMKKLKSINYFRSNLNFSEDMYAAMEFIEAGYAVGYCSTAKVYHTHNYRILDEFKRYKEIGIFHKHNPEIQKKYGNNSSSGFELVKKEIQYLMKKGYYVKIPESILRNFLKYLGYQIGLR